MQLVLSLFPGADLLGKAFESLGFCVVRGPDSLWGGDIREFHVPPGKFDGIIGGPPCQVFSNARALQGTEAINLIPEFIRVVNEARPRWAVMENLTGALIAGAGPAWPHVKLRDYDMSGLTERKRIFWFYGVPPAPKPLKRAGLSSWSLTATSWKNRDSGARSLLSNVSVTEAGLLTGYPGIARAINDYYIQRVHVSPSAARTITVHLLGNGVPRAMGEYVAQHVKNCLGGEDSWHMTGLPLFANVAYPPERE